MTEKLDPYYTNSTMISLDVIKLCFFAMCLMNLSCLMGDINSAYIQAFANEKVYTICGPVFGKRQ